MPILTSTVRLVSAEPRRNRRTRQPFTYFYVGLTELWPGEIGTTDALRASLAQRAQQLGVPVTVAITERAQGYWDIVSIALAPVEQSA